MPVKFEPLPKAKYKCNPTPVSFAMAPAEFVINVVEPSVGEKVISNFCQVSCASKLYSLVKK